MNSSELRIKFLDFFKKNGHKIVPSSSLLPTDSSVLFTTAGMQQFKPYYLGEKSPYGKNVVSCQKCIRTSDIDEVGDERHLTFFEMLGNFSFGQDARDSRIAGAPVSGYFKEEAIKLAYEFIVKELGLEIDYVTVFDGGSVFAPDTESEQIWKSIDPNIVVKKFGRKDNFWGPTGEEGPCGPTTEIYVDGIEIWNIVFNEFYQEKDKTLKPLEIKGVDTGMGLERLAMVVQKKDNVFETDLFTCLIPNGLPTVMDEKIKRIMLDHVRAMAFLISDGVKPLNKDQGYILRRLMRRAMAHFHKSSMGSFSGKDILGMDFIDIENMLIQVVKNYSNFYPELNEDNILSVFREENSRFRHLLNKGLRELKKYKVLDSKIAFMLFETYGLTFEVIKDFAKEEEIEINFKQKDFEEELKKHQELSRTASAGMFKGGLADHSPETIKLHTAHHLLLATLQEVFGKTVKQKGSNINSERLRIDFSFDRKLTDEEKKKIEDMVNEKIVAGLNVVKREMPLKEAQKIGAEMEFGVKYGNTVSVYFIEDKNGKIFSKEFCGGPHVKNTSELGKFKIIKEEASSQGVRRIKAILE